MKLSKSKEKTLTINKVNNYINTQASLSTLSFLTCGSVDDGKSTLIGRLLYEANLIFDDQIKQLQQNQRN